ncbi:MAG: hypothetical protein GY814_06940 [Gammaproteobacteria bacterium]|nr:hypothetical protein [Gammaproteobacteria bacterium]
MTNVVVCTASHNTNKQPYDSMKNSLPILVMLSMLALSQGVMATDFTINTDVTTTNGGNTLDGMTL